MRSVAVFTGSNAGNRVEYHEAARALGRILAERGIALVYGGARVGLMGAMADAALAGAGRVIGVMPESLVAKEVAHRGLTELRVVGTMHERKAAMADMADGFVALPGGFGTLDEFFEVVTWAQLGLHAKPCGLLGVAGYYAPLVAFIDHAVAAGFVRREHREMIAIANTAADLLGTMERYRPPVVQKWIAGADR